jgi:hypothetical protein
VSIEGLRWMADLDRGRSSLPQSKSDLPDVTEELGMLGGVHMKYIDVSNTCGEPQFSRENETSE